MIPKSIVNIAGQEGVSGIYLVIDIPSFQELEKVICSTFDEQWETACYRVKKIYGNCEEIENDWPSGIDVYPWEKGVFITFQAPYISYDNGTKYDTEFCFEVIDNTLKYIRNKYPDCKYYGLAAFVDKNSCIVQRSFGASEINMPKRLEFLSTLIEYINQNVDLFIDNVMDNCYEFEENDPDGKWVGELIDFLHVYEDIIDLSIYDRILSTTCEYIEDDDLYYDLEDKIKSWQNAAGYVGLSEDGFQEN